CIFAGSHEKPLITLIADRPSARLERCPVTDFRHTIDRASAVSSLSTPLARQFSLTFALAASLKLERLPVTKDAAGSTPVALANFIRRLQSEDYSPKVSYPRLVHSCSTRKVGLPPPAPIRSFRPSPWKAINHICFGSTSASGLWHVLHAQWRVLHGRDLAGDLK